MNRIPTHQLGELLFGQMKTLSKSLKPGTLSGYQVYTRGFLRYLHQNFPEVQTPARLKRDPHILGWLRYISERKPPYSNSSLLCRIICVRRLLNDLARDGHRIADGLITTRDIPRVPVPKSVFPDTPFAGLLKEQIRTLSATLRPGTINAYQAFTKSFLLFLHHGYPELQYPEQLQRDPHVLGWLRSLAERKPPYSNGAREHMIAYVRRLLIDLAENGLPVADNLILPRDFPPRHLYLPRPIAPELDNLLKTELRKTDDLLSNALLLIRHTGMRLGECLGLEKDCLRHLGGDHWALHVPLGKLHNERLVPLDDEARRVLDRIRNLTAACPDSDSRLILAPDGREIPPHWVRQALRDASMRAGRQPVLPHQLRHTYATTMVRAGMSLPALKQILGHRDIGMTLRYVQITQTDLQREYLQARQKIPAIDKVFQLPTPVREQGADAISDACSGLDAISHWLQMYRRQLGDQNADRKLHSLLRRLARLRTSLAAIAEKKSGMD